MLPGGPQEGEAHFKMVGHGWGIHPGHTFHAPILKTPTSPFRMVVGQKNDTTAGAKEQTILLKTQLATPPGPFRMMVPTRRRRWRGMTRPFAGACRHKVVEPRMCAGLSEESLCLIASC